MTVPIEIFSGQPLITLEQNEPQSPVLSVPAQGPRGRHGGLAFGWDTNVDVSEPTVGRIKVNSADLSLATKLSISVIDADGNNIEPEIQAWGGSQNPIKAIMRLMKVGDPDSVAFLHLLDNGQDHDTWWEYTVAHVRSAGVFDDGIPLALYAAYSGYKGDIGPAGPTGTIGPQGNTGPQGDPGAAFGITFLWSNSTNTGQDPGVGFIRFNNSTLSSITQISLDNQSALSGNPNVAPFMLTWDDSTNLQKGYLTISEVLDPTTFVTFSITSLVEQAGYVQVNGVTASFNGTFAQGVQVVAQFTRTGDLGATGGAGDAVGIRFGWSSSITTNADPGLGNIRFNNAILASVTQLCIDDTSSVSGNPDISSFVLTWDDSSNTIKGYITIIEVGDTSTFFVFAVTSLVDQVGYTQINGNVVASGGTFTNGGAVVLDYTRAGDQGPAASIPVGTIIQVLETRNANHMTTNAVIPNDDTVPLVTEGLQLTAVAITLSAAANKVLVSIGANARSPAGSSSFFTLALFRGSTCIAAQVISFGADWNHAQAFEVLDAPGSVGPHTYSLRAGPASTLVLAFNGITGSRVLGGAQAAYIILKEVKG